MIVSEAIPARFSPGTGTCGSPHQVKAARGPSQIVARSASITKAHRALGLALTGGVGSPSRYRARAHPHRLLLVCDSGALDAAGSDYKIRDIGSGCGAPRVGCRSPAHRLPPI
jgi:hypothetical protein